MLIDCDTCTARGAGCADCVVTVLLGAPPGWQSTDPVVVAWSGRSPGAGSLDTAQASGEPASADDAPPPGGVVVELDEVERRAVGVLADCGLVPPLRHQPGRRPGRPGRPHPSDRRTG